MSRMSVRRCIALRQRHGKVRMNGTRRSTRCIRVSVLAGDLSRHS